MISIRSIRYGHVYPVTDFDRYRYLIRFTVLGAGYVVVDFVDSGYVVTLPLLRSVRLRCCYIPV